MMKHIQYFAFVAVATIALAACRQEEKPSVTPTPEGPYTYVLAIDGATKAVFDEDHMAWEAGDLIGWYTDKAGSSEVDMNTDPRSFVVSSTDPLAAGSTIYAYAPYQGGELDITAAPFSIPVTQDGSTISSCMPLAAIPVVIGENLAAGDTPIASAQFINLGALVRYNVYSSNTEYASEAVESVAFTASAPIAGDFTMDLTELDLNAVEQGLVPAPSTLTETTVISALSTAAVAGGSKENGVKLYQVVAPGSFSGTITVTTDKAMYTYTLASALDFERGHLQPINLDLGSSKAERTNSVDALLAGTTWKISEFGEYYDAKYPDSTGSSLYADDTITFNADHSITYSIQNGIFYWDGGTDAGYEWTPSGTETWALEEKSDGLYLTLGGGAIPLMAVSMTDAVNGSFKVLSLTEDLLSLYMLITEWGDYQTYVDFVPVTDTPAEEALLAGKTWKISAFGEYYDAKYPSDTGASLYADDTITFNADHSITYSIQNGIFYWDGGTDAGYAWTPTGDETWALEQKSDGLYLTLGGGAIPLMAVSMTDAVNGSFKVLSITEDLLSLYMLITEWGDYQTYVDFVPVTDTPAEEALLTGTTWKISEFGEYYDAKYPDSTGSSLYADDTITFNADHSITYSIQNGIFYWDGGATAGYAWNPSGDETWALEQKSDGLYLTLGGGAIPLMAVSMTDAVNGSFKILSLTENLLSLYMLITEWGDYQTYVDFVPATAVE